MKWVGFVSKIGEPRADGRPINILEQVLRGSLEKEGEKDNQDYFERG
jgi:hypothetical protein